MAEKTLTAIDYTKYWEAERKMLLEATANALPKYLRMKGWEISELVKTSYASSEGEKFKTSVSNVPDEAINDVKTNWMNRSLKARKNVNGENQFISMNMSRNGFMLWVDYNKTPRLEVTQPPRQYFLFAMEAEQKFVAERLHLLPKELQGFVKPFTTAKLNIETLASDYHELEPMRQIAIRKFGPELSKMMDFNHNIKLRYLAKNPTLGVAEKPGGSMMSLFNPSDETVKLRALELAKLSPDRAMLMWLNRKENIEVLSAYRGMAKQIGDQEKITAFYESRKESKILVDKKESEILQGVDTLFKDAKTCQDVAHEIGFKYQRATSEREYYQFERGEAGKNIIVSFPKINPYVYKNHTQTEMTGGNVNSFRQEFQHLKKPVEQKQQIQNSALQDMQSIALKNNLALSVEDLNLQPELKTAPNHQLEFDLSSFKKQP